MSDLIFWGLFAVFLAVLIWAFWPTIARFLRITANEGDELMEELEAARKKVKRKLKR
jgi:fatty acid desaturase